MEYGYAGVPNFGKVLAVAGGAFVVGYFPGRAAASLLGLDSGLDYIKDNVRLVTEVNSGLQANASMAIVLLLVTVVIAGVVGAGLGFLASYPAIRLREDYLAITLLAMGEAIRVVGYNYGPLVGGTLGVAVPDPLAWVPQELRFTAATLIILVFAGLILFYAERLARSPLGRALRAVRDNEVAAASLGKDVVHTRMKVLIVGSALAAIGGALYAFYTGGVIAVAYNRVDFTFWPWVMVMLGGAANNIGVTLGAFLFVAFRKLITFYKGYLAPFIPFDVVWLDMFLLGIVLILILMYRPNGVLPEKPTFTISPSKVRRMLANRMRPESTD